MDAICTHNNLIKLIKWFNFLKFTNNGFRDQYKTGALNKRSDLLAH